jgi:hypothetical protein
MSARDLVKLVTLSYGRASADGIASRDCAIAAASGIGDNGGSGNNSNIAACLLRGAVIGVVTSVITGVIAAAARVCTSRGGGTGSDCGRDRVGGNLDSAGSGIAGGVAINSDIDSAGGGSLGDGNGDRGAFGLAGDRR